MIKIISGIILLLTIYLCATLSGGDEKQEYSIQQVKIDTADLNHKHEVYVPVNTRRKMKNQLRQTDVSTVLKIRNTSSADSIYVFRVDYFDAAGHTIRKYIDSILIITPMATFEIEVKDKEHKVSGDNFIVEWRARNAKPTALVQSITAFGNQKIITEDGILINREKPELFPVRSGQSEFSKPF